MIPMTRSGGAWTIALAAMATGLLLAACTAGANGDAPQETGEREDQRAADGARAHHCDGDLFCHDLLPGPRGHLQSPAAASMPRLASSAAQGNVTLHNANVLVRPTAPGMFVTQ